MNKKNPLVPHINGQRRLWMFPRNIRRISPWKVAQVLTLFYQHSRSAEWHGNQDIQDAFRKSLQAAGLIKPGAPYDPHSGGPRTYEAQLKSLGLIFRQNDNAISLTKAGKDLCTTGRPLPILQIQLLRHQYPSIYGNLRGVKINPSIKIKPFLFILELLKDSNVQYLTNRELCVPVIYGHNAQCKDLCIKKILQLRQGETWEQILNDPKLDLHTSRSEGQSLQKRMADICDIANTFKNCLQACCLITTERIDGEERCFFNPEAEKIFQNAVAQSNNFIGNLENEQSFQRAYGAWDREKDTRNLSANEQNLTSPSKAIIAAEFYKYCGAQIVNEIPQKLVEQLNTNYGFNVEEAILVIEALLPRAVDFFESTFLELSVGGATTATNFEKAIRNIFTGSFHFSAYHTGRQRRPAGNKGGYSDVFVVAADQKHCGIIDGKATSSYSLPSSDYYAMAKNYIPNYMELAENEMDLEFSMYVAGGFASKIDENLRKLNNETRVPCAAIKARDLINLARKKWTTASQSILRTAFRSGKLIRSYEIIGQ